MLTIKSAAKRSQSNQKGSAHRARGPVLDAHTKFYGRTRRLAGAPFECAASRGAPAERCAAAAPPRAARGDADGRALTAERPLFRAGLVGPATNGSAVAFGPPAPRPLPRRRRVDTAGVPPAGGCGSQVPRHDRDAPVVRPGCRSHRPARAPASGGREPHGDHTSLAPAARVAPRRSSKRTRLPDWVHGGVALWRRRGGLARRRAQD